jgi:hypothetical protein
MPFDYLAKLPDDRQINYHREHRPPADVQASPQTTKFTGKASAGRGGFFPTRTAQE